MQYECLQHNIILRFEIRQQEKTTALNTTYQMSMYTFLHLDPPLCMNLCARISAGSLQYPSGVPCMHNEKHCCHHSHGSMDRPHLKATDEKCVHDPKLLLYGQEFVSLQTYKNTFEISKHKKVIQMV